MLINTPGQNRRGEEASLLPLCRKFLGNGKESRHGYVGWAQLQSTHTKKEMSPADSAPLRRAVPTKQPLAALKSLVSQPDLGFRRRLELKTDFIKWPAPLLCPVLSLLPRSSWRWDGAGYPLTLQTVSYCYNQEGSRPSALTSLSNGAQIFRPGCSSYQETQATPPRVPRLPHSECSHTSTAISKHQIP